MSVRRHLALVALLALTAQNFAYAGNGKGNSGGGNGGSSSSSGGSSGNSGNSQGNNSGSNGNNGHYGDGNQGQGHGNTGPGNQGNDKPVGNAGGNSGGDQGGGNSGGGNNGGGNDAGSGNNGHQQENNGNYGEGNQGQGHGNTGPGNQGNDKPVGNAGGRDDSNPGDNPGGGNPGGGNPGGENPGGGNPGGENPGGENPGGENPGGENPGGENPGGENPGGENPGGENPGGENPGGENPGGENPDDETPTDENPQDNPQASNQGEFKFRLIPLVFGDYDSFTRTYNLSSAANKANEITQADEVRLELDNYSEGFRVIKTVDYHLGLGIAGVLTNTAVAGLGGVIGVAPFGGSKIIFNNIVGSEKELKELKRKIPYKANQLDQMKIGESVTLSQRGGLLIGLGVGYYGLGAGAKTLMQGSFTYRVEKLADNLVSVKVEKERLDSATLYAGIPVGMLSATEATKILSGLSYEIDTTDQLARDTYELLMKGDFTFAQADKNLSAVSSIRKIDTYSLNSKSNTRKFYFGIPFLFTSLEKGKTYEHQTLHTLASGEVKSSDYGIYVRERNTRLITVHRNQLETFSGGMAVTRNQQGQIVSSDINGTFNWLYEDDHSSSKKLAKYLKRLAAKTGMLAISTINAPEKEKLGFVEVNFTVNLNPNYLKSLIRTTNERSPLASIWGQAQSQMEEYFARGVDELRICGWNVGKDRLSEAGVKICTKAYRKKIAKSANKIAKQLEKMKKAKSEGSSAFARESARFGQLVWENPFVFRSVTENGFKCGADQTLTISGKRISLYQDTVIGTAEACR